MLNAATVSGLNGTLRENMARQVQYVIDQQVRPLLLRKVREGQLSSTDVADVCQSTAAAFIVAAEKLKIQPAADSRQYDAQIVGRYLHGIALHKLADMRRQLGYVPAANYAILQQLAQQLNERLRSDAQNVLQAQNDQAEMEHQILGLLDGYLEHSSIFAAGSAPTVTTARRVEFRSALLQHLCEGKLKPRRSDFGLITPEAVEEMIVNLAGQSGLRLQPRARKSEDRLPRPASPGGQAAASLSDIADPRELGFEADERLWQQLREAGRACSAQDVVVAYLSFAGASHKSIARHCGIHINTVTNCIRRVVEELRRVLTATEQEVR